MGAPARSEAGRGFSLSVGAAPNRGRLFSPTRAAHDGSKTPDTWRIIGYVRDIVVILGIALGALYLSWHPEKFDAFTYWLIGYRYRH